ncbi:hypothetical protein N0V90_010565 [Kalmusia sp. IMI 367209]|nr:hypothetical protein N0V90_010565 [Kalmusia sp. IMI 367209]
MRVIDRLNDRVKELEEKLEKMQPSENEENSRENEAAPPQVHEATSLESNLSYAFPVHLDPLAELGVNKKYYNWDVVSTRKSSFRQQTYGTSSSFYFINQMSAYMESALQEKHSDIRSACAYASNDSTPGREPRKSHGDVFRPTSPMNEGDLSRGAEEAYLAVFWKSSNNNIAILDQASFEAHYQSLWDSSRALRRSSALVDITLALCMQYQAQLSASTPSLATTIQMDIIEPDKAGMWWHRRGQQLLTDDLEEPSIMTFQCHLLNVMWLSNSGLHNTAHSVMASGIRIGVVLGLHLEPPEDLLVEQREFRRRIWWIAYALEMKFAMDLGRPLAVNCSQVTCRLPSEEGLITGGSKSVVLLTVQFVKLLLATRAVYVTFYRQCANELSKSGKNSIYQDPAVLEECAKFLSSKMIYLRTWVQHVPSVLRPKRKNGDETFSTDELALEFDTSVGGPKMREGIILEIYYHNMAMSLVRPFIVFSAKQGTMIPNTEVHALSCVKHAIAITDILYQVCTRSNYLDGRIEVWQWQWAAALSLIGYLLAYPNKPTTPVAREALDTAVSVLEFQSKPAAAEVVRELLAKADVLSRAQNPDALTNNRTLPGVDNVQISEMPISDLGWDFDFGTDTVGGLQYSLSNGTELAFMADPASVPEDIDASDQSMFDFLNFEGLEDV